MAPKAKPNPEQIAQLKKTLDQTTTDLANAKIAFFSRTDYNEEVVDDERLRRYAQAYVNASHAYQKALYGKVQVRLDVSRLLRE